MIESEHKRIALIMSGCKVTIQEAMEIYKRQLAEEKSNQFARGLVERARQAQKDQKLRRVNRWADRKLLASGE